MKFPVSRSKHTQQEIFEKPRRMGKVPLGGTDIHHALHAIVLKGERLTEPLRLSPHCMILGEQRISRWGDSLLIYRSSVDHGQGSIRVMALTLLIFFKCKHSLSDLQI